MCQMERSKEYFQRISNLLIQYLRKRENIVLVVIKDKVCGYIKKKLIKVLLFRCLCNCTYWMKYICSLKMMKFVKKV